MVNPIEKLIARSFQTMIKTMETELGNLMQNLLKDAITPEMLADMMTKMAGRGDFSRLVGMVGQQSGFDPYRILGIDRSSSDDEVKKRYQDLIKKLHPDTAGVKGTDFLAQMVIASYEIIKRERGWR